MTMSEEGSGLPLEWQPAAHRPTNFLPEHFEKCMEGLLRNPNVLSSHLFRADILYDSQNDKELLDWEEDGTPYPDSHSGSSVMENGSAAGKTTSGGLTRHMRKELRPRTIQVSNIKWHRTVVRELVPRNQNLDKKMVQTVHFVSRDTTATISRASGPSDASRPNPSTTLVFYLPHISSPDAMPFYHPPVLGLCFVHTYNPGPAVEQTDPPTTSSGSLAVHLLPFPELPVADHPKLPRIVANLLTTICKHALGTKNGYEKRVHHDRLIPQARVQDRYARLKEKYARAMIEGWKEVTDPGKHVFEDIAIAAFLIELWRDMYGAGGEDVTDHADAEDGEVKAAFPGFVDIGCGNGLLVCLLRMEGWRGYGFDVRTRKSWAAYPESVREGLKEGTLVPDVLRREVDRGQHGPDGWKGDRQHTGIFAPGTFIISNHADELTAWTPLLAYVNDSPWIAIPCCSHDLGGNRFRAPNQLRLTREKAKSEASLARRAASGTLMSDGASGKDDNVDLRQKQGVETGSLRKPDLLGTESADQHALDGNGTLSDTVNEDATIKNKKTGAKKQLPSAYSALCSYVSRIADTIGYEPEMEMLRIPSTRNACLVGRKMKVKGATPFGNDGRLSRTKEVQAFIESEMNLPVDDIRTAWLARAGLIAGKKGEGH